MKHIKMFRTTLVAFIVALTFSSTYAADDPAANWAFTNKWWAYKSSSYYYMTNSFGCRLQIKDSAAYQKIPTGVLTLRDASNTGGVKATGKSDTIDVRNVMLCYSSKFYAITNLYVGNNTFRGTDNAITNIFVNHISGSGYGVFKSSKAHNIYLEGENFKTISAPSGANYYFHDSSATNIVMRVPNFSTMPNYMIYESQSLKHFELSTTNLTAIGTFDNYTAKPETIVFGGNACSAIETLLPKLLANISGVASSSETGKKTTIYVSKRKKWGWKDSGLIKPLEGNEVNIAPEGCLGVYVVGTARKAWFVHKDSPWEDNQPGFKIIVR